FTRKKKRVLIGEPINNAACYILDRYQKTVPVMVMGELYIAGAGITRGYLNRPELTAERYIDNPYVPGEKMYRTGDMARRMPDGNIEFLGRRDNQVKIRGRRIELAEIENQLARHKYIKECVVSAGKEKKRDNNLYAYIVTNETTFDSTMSIEVELKNHLSEILPKYMIPVHFIQIEKIPLTPNGKADREALPWPGKENEELYTEPGNRIEKKLAEIWTTVLDDRGTEETQERIQTPIGIDNNFFRLGGHSLKATILISKIHKEFNIRLPLAIIFKKPTIRGLTGYIKGKNQDKYSAIESVERKEYYAMSAAQERMYILAQLDLQNTAYNMPERIPIEAKPGLKQGLERTFVKLLERHESLRTSFHMIDEKPVQRIHHPGEIKFSIEDHDNDSIKKFIRSFEPAEAPLLRVGLYRNEEDQYILLIDMHHIISDGVSHEILAREFTALEKGEQLPPLRIQYRDFSQWQRSEKEKEYMKKQEAYWLRQYQGEIPVLELPTDYPRPAIQEFEGNSVEIEIPVGTATVLKKLALQENATLYLVLLTACYLLFSKLSGQEDIVIGTPVAGRRHADLEQVMGMFINTLALRNYPKGKITVKQFLSGVKHRTLEALENQDYHFDQLVDKLEVNRDAGRNPLFDVMFALQDINRGQKQQPRPALNSGIIQDNQQQQNEIGNAISKFDLTMTVTDTGEKLDIAIEYCTKLFKKETIERIARYYKKILPQIIDENGKKISEIEIITQEERSQLLYQFNEAGNPPPLKPGEANTGGKTVARLFEEQTARTPDNAALAGTETETNDETKDETIDETAHQNKKDTKRNTLTYKQLNEKANRLARELRQKGIETGTIAGLMVKRSPEMIVGIMAILKAGGTYLPIDPVYPPERKKHMLADSAAKVLVVNGANNNDTGTDGIEKIDIKNSGQEQKSENLNLEIKPHDLIYTIYTSGSTGKPKGAGVYHKSFTNLVNWYITAFELNYSDTLLLLTSLSFDLTQKNIFAPLSVGGTIQIPGSDYFEPHNLLDDIWKKKITTINCTPGMFGKLVEEDEMYKLAGLKHVFLGGEPVPAHIIVKWQESGKCNAEVVNTYGPTECTDVCSYYRITRPCNDMTQTVPIGRPVYGTRLYILDPALKLVPVGVSGELCIAGAGTGPGYINHPALTNEKFVEAPGIDTQIYKTGDLAKWLQNGNIEFIGRIDRQVKIRGFRIELEEIEKKLLEREEIKNTVVIDRGPENAKYLCAYIVNENETTKPYPEPETENKNNLTRELKEYLAGTLPEYMIPTTIIAIDKIPLTANGKVDRRALPEPRVETGKKQHTPKNTIERKLSQIWQDVLEAVKTDVGSDENFFQLGGHSLSAVLMVSR
ncbi:MAG: amino acid adenylation domain-containing protein, partial [bacterium]|nr:amino acid adenylation domain-containing protein [bacterium]